MTGIVKIEISFPVPVEFPDGWEQTLDALVGMICEKYEAEHPDRTMWPAGHGSKMLSNPFAGDNLKFDDSVYAIDCFEREASEKEMQRRKDRYRALTPYPDFCRHPEKCRGKAACPRELACND